MASRRPPNIIVPGLRSKTGIQGGAGGVLIGRAGGRGPLQVLDQFQQRAMGIRAPSNGQLVNQAGFTFSVEGRPTANQFIGRGVWSKDIHFHNSDPNNVVTATIGASGTPSFVMLLDTLAQLGTIQFTSPTVAVVTWASDPYIHPAGVGMRLYAPNPTDTNLADIAGRVVGYLS